MKVQLEMDTYLRVWENEDLTEHTCFDMRGLFKETPLWVKF